MARRMSLPSGGDDDKKLGSGNSDFMNAFQDHFDSVSRQVEIGLNSVRRVAHLLRKVCVAEQTMIETVKAALENETVKHGDRAQSDLMVSMSTAWQDAQTHVGSVITEQSRRATRCILEVCNPMEDFFNIHEMKRKAILARYKAVQSEMWACRQQCVRGQLSATKALWAAKKKKEKEKEDATVSRTLKTSFLQKMSEVAGLTAGDLHKQAVAIVTQYTTDVAAANARQEQMHREEYPALFSGLEAIEVARLGVLKTKLELYAKICAECTGPIHDVSTKMIAEVAQMKPTDDLANYIQQGFKAHGPPQPPMAYIYGLPVSLKEVKAGRFEGNPDSVFHNTLEAVMDTQKEKYPDLQVPRILVTLSDAVRDLKGLQVEGIFRVSAGKKQLDELHDQFDHGDYSLPTGASPHLPACLLKEWLRELPEPLISEALYQDALALGQDAKQKPAAALSVFNKLDPHPRNVIKHIAWLVQDIAAPDNVEINKMSVDNLAIIFAPSFIRNPADDPMQMMMSLKFETRFIAMLFQAIPSVGKPVHNPATSHAVFSHAGGGGGAAGGHNHQLSGGMPAPNPPARMYQQGSSHNLASSSSQHNLNAALPPSQQQAPPAYVAPAPLSVSTSSSSLLTHTGSGNVGGSGNRPVSPRVLSMGGQGLPPGVVSARPLSPPPSHGVLSVGHAGYATPAPLAGAGHYGAASASKPPPPPLVKPEFARKAKATSSSSLSSGGDSEDEREPNSNDP